ncbi:GNAT family N-acetyltransferase [Candidatus Woesearchaeota archaeon]|nr:GNAT family N-acetyltransferase [Candidatus Woesearchaeota archaeon]
MKLTTNRLVIRDYEKRDIPSLIENINNLEVSKNLLLVPHPYTLKDAQWWINHCAEEMKKKPRTTYDFALELKSEKKLVGGIALNKVDDFNGTAEIGYWLGQSYWRKGFVSEAVKEIVNFGFEKLKLRRIDVCAWTKNIASNELIKKTGFVYEGMRRQAARSKATGSIHDLYIYGLLKEEWEKFKDLKL